MGTRKQSLELAKGQPLASLGLRALLTSPLNSIKVVVSTEDSREWIAAAEGIADFAISSASPSLSIVSCAESTMGMSHSIRQGVHAIISDEPATDAILVTLADQPFICAEMIAELIRYWTERPELDFVATAIHDTEEKEIALTPPAVLSRSMFAALLGLQGDAGARKLFHSPQFKGYCLVAADEQALFDVDTPADLEWAKKHFLDTEFQC
ncbi:NTP transferase domain-containing protein [Paenibacillus sp. LHD-38]|uniref:nucleotidyltransferase family protein n=1 Tax=Paenibacillus sp. LHD-38 TaxID=3072143 RepID=UPI00280DC041|nr:NTP transferase domain-containing protein [Paenibacillus sp. LHD-38]MDQ8735296.1 NTP transferase domain-containing protein [Paenibacillus sp. LHD-38]